MKITAERVGVLIAAIGLIFAWRNDFFMGSEYKDRGIKELCEKFVEYGKSGTLSQHLNIFTDEIEYYGSGLINKNAIKKYYFPVSKTKEIRVGIVDDRIVIDENERIATFTIIREEYYNNRLLSKKTEVTELYYVMSNGTPKIRKISQGRVRFSNFQDSRGTDSNFPEEYNEDIKSQESFRAAGTYCIVNGGRINVRTSPSLRSRTIRPNLEDQFSAYKHQLVELISVLSNENSLEGIHVKDRYGCLILNRGPKNAEIYIVASGNKAFVPNNEIKTIQEWSKVRLQNGEVGYVVSSLITCP